MEFKDYYKILGVTKDTPVGDIKKAYRKLARKYHPDVSTDPDSQDKFKDVSEAYEVLKDPKKKAEYDELVASGGKQYYQQQAGGGPGGSSGPHQRYYYSTSGGGPSDFGDFSEFFESMFGGGHNPFEQGAHTGTRHSQQRATKGQDTHYTLDITLEEAFQGGSKTVQIESLSLDKEGMVVKTPKTLNIKIPKGITEGKSIRLKNQGNASPHGGDNGDLYIKIHILPHHLYSLSGKNITVIVPIAPWEAALGKTIQVPTLKGPVNLKVPAGTQSGKKVRLKGYGLDEKHDQYVQFKMINPELKNEKDKVLYQQLDEHFSFNPRASLGV